MTKACNGPPWWMPIWMKSSGCALAAAKRFSKKRRRGLPVWARSIAITRSTSSASSGRMARAGAAAAGIICTLSCACDVFLIEACLRFRVHVLFQQRQQRHFLLLDVNQHALAQLLPEPAELLPLRFVETARGRLARKSRHRNADRPHRIVLVGQVRADGLVADLVEVGEETVLLEGEMALDLGFHAGGEIRQELGDALLAAHGRAPAVAREQLLQPLHQRNGGAVLLVQRPADAVGEAHRLPHACSCSYLASRSSWLSTQSGFGTMHSAGHTSLHCGSSWAPTHSVHFIGSMT